VKRWEDNRITDEFQKRDNDWNTGKEKGYSMSDIKTEGYSTRYRIWK